MTGNARRSRKFSESVTGPLSGISTSLWPCQPPDRQDLWMRIYSIGKKVSKAPMQQLETPAVAAEEGMLLVYIHDQTKMLILHSLQ